jgi:hypothetical protein
MTIFLTVTGLVFFLIIVPLVASFFEDDDYDNSH